MTDNYLEAVVILQYNPVINLIYKRVITACVTDRQIHVKTITYIYNQYILLSSHYSYVKYNLPLRNKKICLNTLFI